MDLRSFQNIFWSIPNWQIWWFHKTPGFQMLWKLRKTWADVFEEPEDLAFLEQRPERRVVQNAEEGWIFQRVMAVGKVCSLNMMFKGGNAYNLPLINILHQLTGSKLCQKAGKASSEPKPQMGLVISMIGFIGSPLHIIGGPGRFQLLTNKWNLWRDDDTPLLLRSLSWDLIGFGGKSAVSQGSKVLMFDDVRHCLTQPSSMYFFLFLVPGNDDSTQWGCVSKPKSLEEI